MTNAPTDGQTQRTDTPADEEWVGAYGFGGHHGPGYEPQPGERRDAWDRAADRFLAMVGDEDAEKRLQDDRQRSVQPATPTGTR